MNVYKWLDINRKKYGLISVPKTDDVVKLLINNGQPNPKDFDIAVEYDKRGGLIVDIGLNVVEQGKFFNFETKKPHENPSKHRNT